MIRDITVNRGPIEERNGGTHSVFHIQKGELKDKHGYKLAAASVYIERQALFILRSLHQGITPKQLFTLIEFTLQGYEAAFPQGALGIDGQTYPAQSDSTGITCYPEGKESVDLPLVRPLTWKSVLQDVGNRHLSSVSVQTAVADFSINFTDGLPASFSFITPLAELRGLAQLLEKISLEEILTDEALSFFEAMLAILK